MDTGMVRRASQLMVAILLVVAPPGARGGGGFFGATEATQLMNNAELIAQYQQQLEDYVEQARHYANMVRNTDYLVDTVVPQDLRDLVDGVRDIVRQGQAISYAMQNHQHVFQAKFKDWDTFLAGNYGRADFAQDYRIWSQTTRDSIANALQAAGIQMASFDDEELVMSQLYAKARGSQNRNELLSITGQISGMQVRQLQKLRELLGANMQITGAYFAQRNARAAAGLAKTQAVFDVIEPQNQRPVLNNGQLWDFGAQ